jgi:hypothetical protein
MIKKSGKGRLLLGMALGAAAISAPVLTGAAKADDAAMSASMSMPAAPMMVNGKVNNYWTDESGYVTAVDVQTANGPAVIRFAPGMSTRVMQMYPVGSTADLWVKGSMENGAQKWDMVGMGNTQPTSWYSTMASTGMDSLTAMPYTAGDPVYSTVSGKLKKVVVDKDGTVVGLVLDTSKIGKGSPTYLGILGSSEPESTWSMQEGGTPMWTLVRVPKGDAPNPSEGMRRKTPLVINDMVTATGYVEAPMYGATSPYGQRFYANAVTVNGRSVGQMGFPSFQPDLKTLLNFNINLPLINNGTSQGLTVVPAGYEVYNPQAGANMSMGNAMMSK